MKTKTLNKVSTWLPGFDGFYGSWWEDAGEENEIDDINQHRKEKCLAPITWDDCEWDYSQFFEDLSKEITHEIGNYLEKAGFIAGFEYEKLNRPREYNFRNDSIDVSFELLPENENAIRNYLTENRNAFQKYLDDTYTSRSGFVSSYSNSAGVWLGDDYLTHQHKLGAVLNFILRDHLKNDENTDDVQMWLYEKTENKYIYPTNYKQLTEEK